MTSKTQALAQVSMQLGEAIYKAEAASSEAAAASPGAETASNEDVVDAEFSEVNEDDKK